MSWTRTFCVGLILLQILGASEGTLHFATIFPSELRAQHPEHICLQLEGAEGESNVKISLTLNDKETILLEKNFHEDNIFTCPDIQVPNPEENEAVGTITLSLKSSGESHTNSSKVLVKKQLSKIIVQTDKAVYKPGQVVKFRILSLNEYFKPETILIPVVEVQNPDKNRINQWLNVKLNQGMAELSLDLSPEPTLGEYTIKLKDTSHTFSVAEYVLPKFEVNIKLPKYVLYNSETFPVEVCAKYTYGKPVQGDFTASICRESFSYYYMMIGSDEPAICANFTGKLDRSGCHTIDVKSGVFRMNETNKRNELKVAASVTEEGTGVELSSNGQTSISTVINKLSFVNADTNYKPGIPYSGLIKVEDAAGLPKPNIKLNLRCGLDSVCQTLLTDENGQASFTLNTTNWKGSLDLSVQTDTPREPYVFEVNQPDFGFASQHVVQFYSRSKSYLKLNSLDGVLPCEGHQKVHAEYIISHTELEEVKKVSLHYLLVSKVSIKDSGSVDINIENTNEDIYGKVTFNLPLSASTSTFIHALVYIMLPNGEMLADKAKFTVQKCFKNNVSTKFSPGEVLPGSDVSLQVEAAPGSLCGLRVVDQSVVLMKPEKELTANKVFNLFPSFDFQWYDHRVQEYDPSCGPFSPFPPDPLFRGLITVMIPLDETVDVYSMFKATRLKIITSALIKQPLKCYAIVYSTRERTFERNVLVASASLSGPAGAPPVVKDVAVDGSSSQPMPMPEESEKVRTDFPETWIWGLVALGESGRTEIHHKAPDTITDWNAGAVCMGPSGFGLSPSSSLRVFQSFFVDLTLPYAVVKGESFIVKASVFNYLKQCIKVQTTLQTTDELQEKPCAECEYSSCICAEESKTFYWNMKASKLGEMNITVKTEALDTKELCGNEIPVVPKKGRTDTIVKAVLVQPGGVLVEKAQSSLICINDGGQPKVEEISLKIPDNILEDSERAYITVLGDIIGTALQNLDRLLAMPYGCGEQNMVLFAPNIYILNYLEKTHQLNSEILSKAKNFLESGYKRQLTYQHHDGSYSAFGKNDKEGNTWLTGFVVKSFSKARHYIFIDESHLKHSFSWLQKNQLDSGCFWSVGRLFNNAMKGGVDEDEDEDEISLSTYITMSLLEAGIDVQNPLVSNSLACLREASVDVSNVYTQTLLAYTFTLSGDNELRKTLMDKLEKKAVRGDGQLHWKRDSTPPSEDTNWYRAPSAEVEMTSYMLLAYMSGPDPDIGKAAQTVNWLNKQQNPYGGFSSTQDTVVALQAMAKYSEVTFSNKVDMTVAVNSKSGFHEQFHVDKNNRLLLQKATLANVPGDYTVTSTGSGCVFVQAVLRYNIPPPKGVAAFSLSVKSSSRRECLGDPVTKFEILITASYTGTREESNMAVIEVKMVSGYIPVKSTVRKLEKDKLIKRSEIQTDVVTLYLDQIDHNPVNLSFIVEKDSVVKDLKPATVSLYDYYETDENVSVEYNHPCSNEKSENSR
ncbi:alpha-2-macroglobulin-like protein 1 isoform X2 [Bufo gargarizans]|uniref:alpha-2-macroglobulin-like protein 1 isoform X2 n=1 Tax=Bufo gargarizans TaxID=30331 RepID=UPI001CF270E6|nr:alpha-2-macroglobulin-like protein 1 isoform X2 [Bufo gargarizans]